MQPRDSAGAGAAGTSREEKVCYNKKCTLSQHVKGAIVTEEHDIGGHIVVVHALVRCSVSYIDTGEINS